MVSTSVGVVGLATPVADGERVSLREVGLGLLGLVVGEKNVGVGGTISNVEIVAGPLELEPIVGTGNIELSDMAGRKFAARTCRKPEPYIPFFVRSAPDPGVMH